MKNTTGTATASNFQTQVINPSWSTRKPLHDRSPFRQSVLLGILCLGWAIIYLDRASTASETIAIQSSPANSSPNLEPDPAPLDLATLYSGQSSDVAITSTTFVKDSMVMPSLWWIRDQFAAQPRFGKHFVKNWLVQPIQSQKPGRVDLVVDQNLWSGLDYLDRYEFITGFGTDTHRYGYNLRVFDERGRSLGASTCDFRLVSSGMVESKLDMAALPTTASAMLPEVARSEQTLFPLDLGQLTCRVNLNLSVRSMVRGSP